MVGQQPDSDELSSSIFARIYASVYSAVLVAIIGGGLGGFLFAFKGSITIDRIKHPPPPLGYATDLSGYHDPRSSIFRIFYDLGITDWRALFGIGAIVGIGCVALYLKAGKKITIVTCLLVYLVLELWVLWTKG